MNTEAVFAAALFQRAHEYNLVTYFLNADIEVLDSHQILRQLIEFVVVCSE